VKSHLTVCAERETSVSMVSIRRIPRLVSHNHLILSPFQNPVAEISPLPMSCD
jgi:hypothetical protein